MEVAAEDDNNHNNVGGTNTTNGGDNVVVVVAGQDVDAKNVAGSTTTTMRHKDASPPPSPPPPPPPPISTTTDTTEEYQCHTHGDNNNNDDEEQGFNGFHQNHNHDGPVSPPNVARSLIPEREPNEQEQEQQQTQQSSGHNSNKEQQLEDRVQELEEKLATLSRLLIMQPRQAASSTAAAAATAVSAAAGGGGRGQQQHNYDRHRHHRHHHHRDASSDEDGYADEEEYYYDGGSSIHHNLSSTILSVTPPGSPSPYSSLWSHRRSSYSSNRRIDGSMHVALESPAPSRRPTMELLHSPISDDDIMNNKDYDEEIDDQQVEDPGEEEDLRYNSAAEDSGNHDHDHHHPIPPRITQHQRNLSYRVFNTNEFAAPAPSPPPLDEEEIRDDEDRKGEFAPAAGTGITATSVVTEGEETGWNEDEKGPLIASTRSDQNHKTENDLVNEMHSRIDIDLINQLNSTLRTTKEVVQDPSRGKATPQSSPKQSDPGIFLPNVLSEEDDNNSIQPQAKIDTNLTNLTVNNVSSSDSNLIVNKTDPVLVQPSSQLLKRTKATSKNTGTNESPSTLKKVLKDNDSVTMIGESPKKARSSVASALTFTSEKAAAADNITPTSQKSTTLKRERSLSVASAQSSSTRVTNRSDNQGGHPGSSSTSNKSSIKSKWLDYLNSVQESNYDTDKQMEEFVKVPSAVEGLLSYGFWICVDSFLYSLTILPIRFVWSCLLLIRFVALRVWQSSVPEGPFRFNRRHFYQLIQVSIIYGVYAMVLKPIDISILYHWIRVQNMVKLYLLIAIVEVFDRLMCSLGQDCLDSLYWNTTRRPRSFRHLVSVVVVLTYTALHSILLFVHVATMNVAMNSSDQALLSLLIGGNFAEIKSTVFKKYNKASLFKITASDVCERFKLGLFLVLVLSLNFSQGMEKKMLIQYFHMCGIVWCAEWLSDWIKHSFITKFNYITSGVYSEYGLLLAGDVTGMGHEGLNLDSSHSVVRRLGLAQIPLVVVMCKYLREAYKYATYENSLPSWAIWLGFSVVWSALLVCKLSLGKFLHKISMQKLEAAPAFSKSQSTVAKKKA